MAVLVLDPEDQRAMIARRRRLGIDRYDEVWEGTYLMSPMANDEHQELIQQFISILGVHADLPAGTKVRPGVNISDRVEGWKKNYRCPDVVVFLPDTTAVCHDVFWHGGPDFAVEVRSRGDRTRRKLPFYASVGTREVLVVDRNPWRLQLYRLADGRMISAGVSTLENHESLPSAVLPLTFRLIAGPERPVIDVAHADGRRWAA